MMHCIPSTSSLHSSISSITIRLPSCNPLFNSHLFKFLASFPLLVERKEPPCFQVADTCSRFWLSITDPFQCPSSCKVSLVGTHQSRLLYLYIEEHVLLLLHVCGDPECNWITSCPVRLASSSFEFCYSNVLNLSKPKQLYVHIVTFGSFNCYWCNWSSRYSRFWVISVLNHFKHLMTTNITQLYLLITEN